VSIQSGFIGEWEGQGVYVELVVSDRGNVVFDKKAFAGARIPVRSDADESLTIVVDNVEQHPKDPTKTWDDLKKLGLAAESFIERKAVLMVSGKTRSPGFELPAMKKDETEDDSSEYKIKVDFMGPVDARKLDKTISETYLMKAVQQGNLHDLKALLRAGNDVNYENIPGCTLLLNALLYKQLNCFKYLLSMGADTTIRDSYGKTVLDYANSPGMQDYADALKKIKPKSGP